MSTDTPLVSVICLCYNHERFVEMAISSVFQQTYKNIELIVVDDHSSDNSVAVITALLKPYPEVKFISLSRNHGNCTAFNRAFAQCKGEFVIDLAADDILLPERVAEGVAAFQQHGNNYAVNFTNAALVSEAGEMLYYHYPVDDQGHAIEVVPEGNIYLILIQRYFICAPTVMVRTNVLRSLGGYDENLAYEDFDFWVRSSRYYQYCYTDKVLVRKRKVENSLSQQQYKWGSVQMISTYEVCKKIKAMNTTAMEGKALVRRILFEMKACLKVGNINLFFRYLVLLFY